MTRWRPREGVVDIACRADSDDGALHRVSYPCSMGLGVEIFWKCAAAWTGIFRLYGICRVFVRVKASRVDKDFYGKGLGFGDAAGRDL